jgi:hypothetical protein
MSWQPIYGEMSDDNGTTKYTSSRRGTNYNVWFKVDTTICKNVCSVKVNTTGNISSGPYKRLDKCRDKVIEYKDKPKKLLYWTEELKIAEGIYNDIKSKESDIVRINTAEHAKLNINGVDVQLKHLLAIQHLNYNKVEEALKIIATIVGEPDLHSMLIARKL